MASKLDIWNLALSHIGDGDDVDDVAEATLEAEECRKYYPNALKMVLERHNWDFAIKTVALALHSEAAPSQWTYRYGVPSDYIKALKVFPNLGNTATTWLDSNYYTFDIDGQSYRFDIEVADAGAITIVTNEAEAHLRYVYRNENAAMYSPGFVLALSFLLASFLAGGPILKSSKKAMEMMNAYELTFGQGRVNNSNASYNPVRHVPAHLRRR